MRNNLFYFGLITLFFACVYFFGSCTKNHSVNGSSVSIVISSYYPDSAGMGDTVTIYGKNLPADLSAEKITINNKTLTVISSSPDSLKFIIPKLLGSGPVTVTIGSDVYHVPDFTYNYRGVVTTVAGTGAVGTNDGPGGQASFYCPWGITADLNGDLYVADCYNRLIRKVTAATGAVSTIHIPVTIDTSHFYSPYNIALDKVTHNLYVTDFNLHVLKIDGNGGLSVINIDSMPTTGIALGPDGFLYMSNNSYGTIMRMDTSGQQRTFLPVSLITPRNIVFDKAGNMFVAAYSGSAIVYTINTAGKGSIAALDKGFQGWEIAVDTAGNFYEADHFGNQIRMIEKSGRVSIIAGSGNAVDVDGVCLNASFDGPQGLTIDSNGNLYVTTYNYNNNTGNKIRKITLE